MYLLHRIGTRLNSNFNSIEEIVSSTGPLSFDGIYTEVLQHWKWLEGRDVTFFVMGDYVGLNNEFDRGNGQPPGDFCTWDEIIYMTRKLNAKIGWHTWSHPNLLTLSDEEVIKEITPPFPMTDFAYPGACVDERVKDLVRQVGYKRAWGVNTNNSCKFNLNRRYLNW